jgi:CHAT domain-containing protein/Tfp pilus assembly protein PilF
LALVHSSGSLLKVARLGRNALCLLRVLPVLCLAFSPPTALAATDGPNWSFAGNETRQDQPSRLVLNEVVQRVIRGGETHTFTLTLAAERQVRLVVQRLGIDLFVKIISPDGSANRYENPAGAQSLIPILLNGAAGSYTIEIHPSKKWLAAGRYEIRAEEVVGLSLPDAQRLAAQRKLADAGRHTAALSASSGSEILDDYEAALLLWREAADTFQEANTLQLIAQTYLALGEPDKALEYYNLALVKRGDDKQARAYTLLDLADAYSTIKSPLESLPHYENALAAFRENQNPRGQALTLVQLGLIHMRQYDWESARKILEEALDIDRIEGDVFEQTRVLNALGGVADNQGQPEQAVRLYEQARDAFHLLGDTAREGNMYINIGLHHDTWGEWQEAFTCYYKAFDLFAAAEADAEADRSFIKSKRASLFYNLGSLFASLGDYEQGLHYLQESLDLRPATQQGPTLMWFGYTYVLAGEPTKALPYCNRAITLQEKSRDPRIGQTYTVMGMTEDALGNHDEAVKYFDKALEIQGNKNTLDLTGQAITLDKRGSAYAALGEMNKARSDLEAALTLWRAYKDRNGEALTLFHLASVESDSGHIDLALANSKAATTLIEPLRENVMGQQLRASYFADKVDYYDLYIDLLMRSRRPENSEAMKIVAFEASERARARGLLDLRSEENLAAGTDPELAMSIEKRRLLQRSILIKLTQRLQVLAKNSNDSDLVGFDRDIANLNTEQGKLEAEIRSRYPRYAALMSSHPQNAETIQRELDSDTLLLEYALGKKRSYGWVVSADSIDGFELAPRDQIEGMVRRITEALTARNHEVKNETFAQKSLRVAKAEEEYSELSFELSKLILEPVAPLLNRPRLVVVADGALQLVPFWALPAPISSTKREALTTQTTNSATTGAGNGNSQPTSMSPALVSSLPLIKTYEIVMLPSASVLALQRRELVNRKPAPLAVAVLADPVYDFDDARIARATGSGSQHSKNVAKSGEAVELTANNAAKHSATISSSIPVTSTAATKQSPLASALRDVGLDPNGKMPRLVLSRREATAIARSAPVNQSFSALDFKASRETAMSSELSKYRIIHFATHGVLDLVHPELSGLVLSMVNEKGEAEDGYLRLHEIYNLNLPADLVVLSACQTGIGKQIKGEGLIALTRGFMYAGAKSVVASLWKVDDAATSALMADFYKQMFINKLKPAAALRQAQINLSLQKRWHSPYYWAGFFIQGEWN